MDDERDPRLDADDDPGPGVSVRGSGPPAARGPRIVGRVAAFVVVAAAIAMGPSTVPAGACSCAENTVEERVAAVDVVVVGEVVRSEAVDEPDSVLNAVRNTVAVERVYAGEAAAEIVVFGGESSSGACEYAFEEGRYLIYGSETDGGLETNLCTGTTSLEADEAVPPELGTGVAPLAAEAPNGDADGGVVDADGAVVDDDGVDIPLLVLIGAAAVVAVAAGAALALRLRSRPARP